MNDERNDDTFNWGAQPGQSQPEQTPDVHEVFDAAAIPVASEALADDARRVPAGEAGFAGVGEEPMSTEASHKRKLLWWIAGGLVALLVVVGVFVVVNVLPKGSTATPTESSVPTPTAPAALGTAAWDQLYGGECLDPFTDAWQMEYTVVDCSAAHAAQLVYRGVFEGDNAPATFPGEEALGSQINALCTRNGIFDVAAASAYSKLQVQGSYPVTAEQWDAGARTYYCFVNQSDGATLTGSLAGAGPQ
ncbi:MAG: septum formation family protein [Agromyces sp.]